MKINIITENQIVTNPRIEYVINFIQNHPLCPQDFHFSINDISESDITIAYSQVYIPSNFWIPKNGLFIENQLDNQTSNLFCNTYFTKNNKVYSVEIGAKTGHFHGENQFGFDILSTIFFHISRYEEYFSDKQFHNKAGWLDENNQLLIQNDLNTFPIIDELLVAFFEEISNTTIKTTTTYDISHDLDILFRFKNKLSYIRSLAATIYHRRGWSEIKNIILHFFVGNKDPYDTFDWMLSKGAKWKRKNLFLMVGGNTHLDNQYDIQHPYIQKIISLSKNRNYEIGLHPSYNAGFDNGMYTEELKLLSNINKQQIIHNRQHWLRFNWLTTPKIWASNYIKFDFTMGYNNHIGFRCGTGFPYQMYDFQNEKPFEWVEVPLVFMDSSLKHHFLKRGGNMKAMAQQFIEKNRYNTHISFNFHNSNFDELTDLGKELKDIYWEILKLGGDE